MFTGLIQAIGSLELIASNRLRVMTADVTVFHDLAIGDSVAVDGVCLTAEETFPLGFVATVSPETLYRSTLADQSQRGGKVNLETSLRVGSKLGGHFVTGHVDGVGEVRHLLQTGDSWEIRFSATAAIAAYIIPKGSIAVNGVSLTVAECHPAGDSFSVAVIPHSFMTTNLHLLEPGSPVNLEADLLGKYVAKLLKLPPSLSSFEDEKITPDFLAEHGFL